MHIQAPSQRAVIEKTFKIHLNERPDRARARPGPAPAAGPRGRPRPAAGCYDIYEYGQGTNKKKNYDRKLETY